jgi:hypothetical protein
VGETLEEERTCMRHARHHAAGLEGSGAQCRAQQGSLTRNRVRNVATITDRLLRTNESRIAPWAVGSRPRFARLGKVTSMPQASSTFATLPSEAAPVQGHGYHTNIKACHKAVWIPNGPTDPKDIFLFATPQATDAPQSKNTLVDGTRPPSARRTRTPLRSASARRREPLTPASRGSAQKRMVPYAAHPDIPAAATAPGYPPGALPASKYTEADCYDEGNLPHTEAAHR